MAAEDRFDSHIVEPTGSITRHHSVVPNDGEDLPFVTRAVWTDTGGIIVMTTKTSPDLVLPYTMQPGMWNPIRAVRIFSTGTTAEGIKAGD
jgi:hypothetical protein